MKEVTIAVKGPSGSGKTAVTSAIISLLAPLGFKFQTPKEFRGEDSVVVSFDPNNVQWSAANATNAANNAKTVEAALKALVLATTTDRVSWETEAQVQARIQECRHFAVKALKGVAVNTMPESGGNRVLTPDGPGERIEAPDPSVPNNAQRQWVKLDNGGVKRWFDTQNIRSA